MGPGQSGVLALTEGWVTVPSCTVVWGGWLPGAWCRRHTRCCLMGGGGCPLCVPWRVWGWHAVGVLGQCALVARPVQGSISWGFGWVWVGWL